MSFPAYPSYRESGIEWIGPLPSDWQVLPLLAVADECDRSNRGMVEDNLLSLSYGSIVRKDISASDGLLPESFETYQVAEPNDIVWRLTDLQNDKRSLRTAIVRERGIITSAYLATAPHGILPDFLGYLLRAYDQEKVFYSMGGGLRQSMKFSDVRRMPIIVPSEHEQTTIVAFLDRETAKIDALVEEQRRLIELLKEKRRAVISHAVTKGLHPTTPMKHSGVEWLGEVPAHWEVKPLKQLAAAGTSITYGIVQAGPDIPDGVPYIRTSDMSGDELPEEGYLRTTPEIDEAYARSRVFAGDLVIAIRATIGKPLMVPPRLRGANLTQGTAKFSPGPAVSGHYIQLVLSSVGASAEFERVAKGATFKEITLDMLRRFRVPVPPLVDQYTICDWAGKEGRALLDLEKAATEAEVLLKERRSALISAAVTGKIDVRPAQVDRAEAA